MDDQTESEWRHCARTEPRGTLAAAIAIGRRPECRIGQVLEPFASYRKDDFVIVSPYAGDQECTVEMPMTPGMIAVEKSRGSLLQTWLCIVCVPMRMVRIVL